jgi:hypothetical protein
MAIMLHCGVPFLVPFSSRDASQERTVPSTSGFRFFLRAPRFLRTDITAKPSMHFIPRISYAWQASVGSLLAQLSQDIRPSIVLLVVTKSLNGVSSLSTTRRCGSALDGRCWTSQQTTPWSCIATILYTFYLCKARTRIPSIKLSRAAHPLVH